MSTTTCQLRLQQKRRERYVINTPPPPFFFPKNKENTQGKANAHHPTLPSPFPSISQRTHMYTEAPSVGILTTLNTTTIKGTPKTATQKKRKLSDTDSQTTRKHRNKKTYDEPAAVLLTDNFDALDEREAISPRTTEPPNENVNTFGRRGVLPPPPPPAPIGGAVRSPKKSRPMYAPPPPPGVVSMHPGPKRTASLPPNVGGLAPAPMVDLQSADLFGGMASLSQPMPSPSLPRTSSAPMPRGGMALGRWLQCRLMPNNQWTESAEISVECNGVKAMFVLSELKVRMPDETGELVAPGEFERRVGLGKCRKWKETVRVMGAAAEKYKHVKLPAAPAVPPVPTHKGGIPPPPGTPSRGKKNSVAVHRTASAPVGGIWAKSASASLPKGIPLPPPPPPPSASRAAGGSASGAGASGSGSGGSVPPLPRPPPARYGPYPPLGEWLRAPEARGAIIAGDIQVDCNGTVGVLRVAQNGNVVIRYEDENMHCGEFERRCGKGRSRKWKETCRVLNGSHVPLPPPEMKVADSASDKAPRQRKHLSTGSPRVPQWVQNEAGFNTDQFFAANPVGSCDDSDLSGGDYFLYGPPGDDVYGPPAGPGLKRALAEREGFAALGNPGATGLSPPDVTGGADVARSLGLVPGGNSPPFANVLVGGFSPPLPAGIVSPPDGALPLGNGTNDDLLVFMPDDRWD